MFPAKIRRDRVSDNLMSITLKTMARTKLFISLLLLQLATTAFSSFDEEKSPTDKLRPVIEAKRDNATFDSVQWYCMAKKGATDIVLKEHIDGACAMRGVDCRKIEDGGPCGGKDYWFKASYALNTYCIYYAHVGAVCEDFDIGNLTAVEPHISEDLNGIKPRDDVNCFLPPINMAKTSMKVGENPNVDPALNPKPTGTKGKGNKWCVSNPWAGEKELEAIQNNLCKNKLVKQEICEAMQDQPKRGPCFVRHKSRVSYAMNAYYQSKNGDERSCDFNGSGTIVDKDPSHGFCIYVSNVIIKWDD